MANFCKNCGNKLCRRSNRHHVTGLCKTCYNKSIHQIRRKTNHDPYLTEFKKLLKKHHQNEFKKLLKEHQKKKQPY